MNLLEQSWWWLIPYVLLILIMVHAMMEFTVSLLIERPQPNRKPIAASELRERLLALNTPAQGYQLVEGRDCDLEIYGETVAVPPTGRFVMAKGASLYHLRFLLDEQRHELRMNQVARSYHFFLGLVGWLPRLSGSFSIQAGPPDQAMTKKISQTTNRNGWGVRPMLWWFQTTHRGYQFLERLTPEPFRRWPARRFWGILYPLSYVLGVGYMLAIIGPLDWDKLLLALLISALWWGIWGFLVWMLCGFPTFWRRRRP